MDSSLNLYRKMQLSKIQKFLLPFLIAGLIPAAASITQLDVLVVDDGHTLSSGAEISYGDKEDEFRERYRNALESIEGVETTFKNTTGSESGPTYEELSRYDAVVWYTLADTEGVGYTTFTSEDVNNLQRYMENGGSVYVTGHRLDDARSDLKGSGSFYRDYFSVRIRDTNAVKYWRLNYKDEQDKPARWVKQEVTTDTGSDPGYPPYNTFDRLGNVFLQGNGKVTSGLGVKLNTSIEPPSSVGVITDNCLHEEESNLSEEYDSIEDGDQDLADCEGFADDSLDYMNNINLGESDKDQVQIENTNGNDAENSRTLSVDYSGDNDRSVILAVTTLDPDNSTRITDVSHDNPDKIIPLSTMNNSYGRLNTYLIKDVESDGSFDIRTDKKTHLSAMTVTVKKASRRVVVADLEKNRKDSGDISTTVDSWDKDTALSFLYSIDETKEEDTYNTVGIGDDDAQLVLKEREADEGSTTVTHHKINNSLQTVMTIESKIKKIDEEKDKRPQYFVETDGGRLTSKFENLEKEGRKCTQWETREGSGYEELEEDWLETDDGWQYYEEEEVYIFGQLTIREYCRESASDFPDERSASFVNSFGDGYRTAFSSIGFESIARPSKRKEFMERTVRFLTGPVSNKTSIRSGRDIPGTPVDESRYTNSTVGIDAVGLNLQPNPSKLVNARLTHNLSVNGLEQPYTTSFESGTESFGDWEWNDDPSDDYYYESEYETRESRFGQASILLGGYDDTAYLRMKDGRGIDISGSRDLELEFWFRPIPEDWSRDPADKGQDSLGVYFAGSGDVWEKAASFDGTSYSDWDTWHKAEVPIDQDELSQEFRIEFDPDTTFYDGYLIDGVSIDKGLPADDGSFSEVREPVGRTLDVSSMSEVQNVGAGKNITFATQFKDNSRQGYWGPLTERWMRVDVVSPESPAGIEPSTRYTNRSRFNLTLSYRGDTPGYRPDLVRFSCDRSSWSDWKYYNDSQTTQQFPVAVNSTKNGCGTDQGNKTVWIDVRDYAGNEPSSDVKTWVVYDTEAPEFQGAKPQNRSAIPTDPSVNITATDENPLPDSFGSEDVSLYNILTGGSGQFLVNQSFGIELDTGLNTLIAEIYDKASNVNRTRIRYDKDTEAPDLNVTPENRREPSNNTVVKPGHRVELKAFDRNFDRMVVNNDSGTNETFDSNTSWTPGWNEGISETLNVWVNDTAGNKAYFRYNYSVDGTPPQLSAKQIPENTYVRPEERLRFNFSDSLSSVVSRNASRPWYPGSDWDMVVEPEWDTGPNQEIKLNATDAAGGTRFDGNQLQTSVTYDVDGIRPQTSVNYSSSDAPVDGWFDTNTTLELNASDNMALSTINYTVGKADAAGYELSSSSETNTTVQIGCDDGDICEKVLVRKAFDEAGNPSSQEKEESDVVRIDKKAPRLTITGPPNATVSENVSIQAEVSDPGVGLQDVTYSIIYRSNESEIDSGQLTGPDYETLWNSSEFIEGTEKLALEIDATDRFSQTTVKTRDFTVENQQTTVTINSPSSSIVGENFTLDVEAARPGDGDDLAEHNLSIREKNGEVFYSRSDQISGQNTHSFYQEDFNVSKLGSDGDYVLNTSARSEGGEKASSNQSFYLDTTPPDLSMNDSLNNSWVTGTVSIDINASDDKKNGTIVIQYRNQSSQSWELLRERDGFSTEPVTFDTEDHCSDSSQNSCGVRIKASDSVGNVNTSKIRFKVDNTPPNVSIDSPEPEAWLNESFTVERTVSDNVLDTDEIVCEVRINDGQYSDRASCSNDFTVEVPEDCSEASDSYCSVDVRASHPELPLENTTVRRFRIDTTEPEIFSGPTPSQGTYLNGSEKISIGYRDQISSISYERYDDGSRKKLDSQQPFEPAWTQSGQKTLEILLNDSAGNLRTEDYSYIFDNEAPELKESNLSVKEGSYSHARVYRGEDLYVNVNVSENIEMKKAWIEITHDGNKWNRTLQLSEGTREEGLWRANLANDTLGLYSVEKIYLKDRAGNRTTGNPSSLDFKVVTFDASVQLGSNTEITAGNQTDFTYTINFNRTAGERNLTLELPATDSPLLELEELTCDNIDQKNCRLENTGNKVKLLYNGSQREFVDVIGRVEASTPDKDVTDSFKTSLQGNTEKDDITVRSPSLTLENATCSPSCTLNQSQNFNLTFDLMNNNTASNSGTAIDVNTWLDSSKLDENLKNLGNVQSGDNPELKFEGLSIGEVGQYEIQARAEDATGVYGSEAFIQVDIRDSEPPQAGPVSISEQRINVNGTMQFSTRLTDNVEVKAANLTLAYPNGTEYNVSLSEPTRGNEWSGSFSRTAEDGIYDVKKLTAVDRRGNELQRSLNKDFKVTRLQMNASITSEKRIRSGSPVNFSVNVSGNSTELKNIVMNVTSPGTGNKTVTYTDIDKKNNLTFEGLKNSGNHSFTFTANAGFSVSENTSDIFVKYGEGKVSYLENLNGSRVKIPADTAAVSLYWNLSTINGSIGRPEISGSSTDSGVATFSTSTRTLENLTYRESERIIRTEVDPEGTGEAELRLDVTPQKGGEASTEVPVEVVSQDDENPELQNLSVGQYRVNLGEALKVSVVADDNTVVKNVTLELERPTESGSVTEKFQMNRSSSNSYSAELDSTEVMGEYNISVTAYDYSGNSNSSEDGFNVTDEYTVSVVPDQDVYVKQEYINMDFVVRDASGERITEGYNITAKMQKDGENITLVNSTGVTEDSFFINDEYVPHIDRDPENSPDDPDDGLPMNYTAYVNVSRDGNAGSTMRKIKVTRVLDVSIEHKKYVAPGEEFQVTTRWTEPENDPITGDLNAYILCDRCPSEYKPLVENLQTGEYQQTLTAPNSTDGYSFKVRGSAYGNSESQNPDQGTDAAPFSTFQVVTGGTPPTENNTQQGDLAPGGGGFAGGGGGPVMQINRISPPVQISPDREAVDLSVNTNIAAQCVYSPSSIPQSVGYEEASNFTETGGVNHSVEIQLDDRTAYSYSVMCASGSTNATMDIIFSTKSLDVFRFTAPASLTPGNGSVTQFSTAKGHLVVYNNQEKPVTVNFDHEVECCNLSVTEDGESVQQVTIPSGSQRNLNISVYAPLYVSQDTYEGTLNLTSSNDSISHPFNFQVSRHPAVENYTQLLDEAQLLNTTIDRYEIAGIDTSKMRKNFRDLMQEIREANASINDNDLQSLEQNIAEGRAEASEIDTMLEDASLKKYILLNWWKYALGFMLLYITFFLVTVVGIPYYRIKTEMVRIDSELEDQVEARKKGEKQYFKRQIDKDTFNEMMQDRQNEILELRGEKEDLNEEMDGFLWKKLTLENYLKAPWKGMEELEKWWAANRRARQNIHGEEDQEDEE